MIPFFDLKRQYFEIKNEIDKAIQRVFDSGNFILGDEVKAFEKEFSSYCSVKTAVGLASGTDALHLSLSALDLKKGSEVITVANTAVPTVAAILMAGLKPVFVEIGDDFLIDISKIEEKITENTSVILPVHLYGLLCDMKEIMELAEKHNLFVVEDACQAHGAELNGKKAGCFGHIACFSFYPTKNLGCYGDGGMVITNDEELAEKIRMLRQYGEIKRYYCEIEGFNSRLDEIQAAILRVKLKYLDKWNKRRRKNAQIYSKHINSQKVSLPFEPKNKKHVFHIYAIKTDVRDSLRKYLLKKNIHSMVHYPIPIHFQRAYSHLGFTTGSLPKTEKTVSSVLSLPMFPELKAEEIEKIAEEINNFFKSKT